MKKSWTNRAIPNLDSLGEIAKKSQLGQPTSAAIQNSHLPNTSMQRSRYTSEPVYPVSGGILTHPGTSSLNQLT